MPRNSGLYRVAVAVVSMFLAVSAFAQRSRPSTAPLTSPSLFDASNPIPGTLTPCMFLVNLSDAQKAQIQSILLAAQPQLESLATQLKSDRAALDTAAASRAGNACDVGTAYLKVQTDQNAIAAELLVLQPQIESVLTPDQKSKLAGCLAALANFAPKP